MAGEGVSAGARLYLAVVGMIPVSLVGFATFGVFELRTLALGVLVPALAGAAVVLRGSPAARRLVVTAVVAGMLATFLYDLFRWSFLVFGWMDRDPIPHIGTDLGLAPGWVFGYLWRYFGNGGGLAVAFFALGGRGARAGVGHGVMVCTGLVGVLLVSPHGQEALFPLVAVSLFMAITGHIIYGATLGVLSRSYGVVDCVNDRGVPTAQGEQWYPATVRKVVATYNEAE